jgi:Fe-S-cluster containining protein
MSFLRVLQSGSLEKQVRALWRQSQDLSSLTWRQRWRLARLQQEFDFTQPNPPWRFDFPTHRVPACARCPDPCCKGPHNTVLLRLVDVALFIDRGWTDAITLEKPVFSDDILATKPQLKAMVESFHWRVFPVLKQKTDQTCVFLSADGQCNIHPERPWICRVFPYLLDVDQQAIHWSSRCQWFDEEETETAPPAAQELQHAVLHNFYTEKVCDLVIIRVFREELAALGITAWLNLADGSS